MGGIGGVFFLTLEMKISFFVFFLCIRQSKLWPHARSGTMAMPRSVLADMPDCLRRWQTIAQISDSGTFTIRVCLLATRQHVTPFSCFTLSSHPPLFVISFALAPSFYRDLCTHLPDLSYFLLLPCGHSPASASLSMSQYPACPLRSCSPPLLPRLFNILLGPSSELLFLCLMISQGVFHPVCLLQCNSGQLIPPCPGPQCTLYPHCFHCDAHCSAILLRWHTALCPHLITWYCVR